MSDRSDKVRAFVEKLMQLVGPHKGHYGVRSDQVLELVGQDPEAAAGAVPYLIRMGEQQCLYLQLAMTIAAAYQQVTEDDSLARVVERAMEHAGVSELAIPPIGDERPEPRQEILQLMVDPGDLERCNIYSWTRQLSLESLEDALPDHATNLRRMRGRCLLTFPLDADPRTIYEIPEARAFIRALFEAMPYFPYYLDFDLAAGSFSLFFGCVADPEALQPGRAQEEMVEERQVREYWEERVKLLRRQGKAIAEEETSWHLNIMHPSVIDAVSTSVAHLSGFCRALGDDPIPTIEALLTPYPDESRQEILATIEEG
jgi:hypothetical protein